MAIDPPPPPPKELRQLEEILAHCEKRVTRAGEKLAGARGEEQDAKIALLAARVRLRMWRETHPEPQMQLI